MNKLSDQKLQTIVQNALSISDRIKILPQGWYWGQSSPKAKQRIERWLHNAAGGDPHKFQRRWQWAGLNRNALHRLMSEEPVLCELPDWVNTFSKAMEYSVKSFPAQYLSPENPAPFEDILIPFVEVAREQLALQLQQGKWRSELFAPDIFPVLERQLLGSLASLSGRAFQHQFTLFRAQQQPVLSRLMRHLKDYQSTTVYQSYIQSLQEGKLIDFFLTYPVLARMMSTVTDFWVAATAEFLQRLTIDFAAIESYFSPETPLGEVTSLKPELGDPHNQGRSVMAIGFASGQKLVYKPRSLGAELAYQTWIEWLNRSDALLPMTTPAVFDRGTYGWMKFVEPFPCQDYSQVENYYRRAGQLLGLMHILGGNDCHYENIIAMGEYPVLIDLETLLHHEFREEVPQSFREGSLAVFLAQEKLRRSVVRVGLLPRWDVSANGQNAFDLSGLGSIGGQEVSVMIPTWQDINTDKMMLSQAPAYTKADGNTPELAGRLQPPTAFVPEIVAGFSALYQFVMTHKTTAPIAVLNNQSVRSIYRPTQIYASILDRALRPTPLQNGIDFSLELELLARPLLWSSQKHPLWPLIEAEIRSLWQFDMPFFRTNSAHGDLWEGDRPLSAPPLLQDCFVMSSISQVEALITSLSPADLSDQVEMIRASLYSTQLTSAIVVEAQQWEVANPASPNSARAGAVAIGEDLSRRAIRGDDGSVSWIGLGYLPGADRFRLQPVEFALYDGAVGISLFLAALYHTTGDRQWQELSLGALRPLQHLLRNTFLLDIFSQQVGIGGAVGLGSLVYGLTKIAGLLQESSLLEDAERCAALITTIRIDQDHLYDIVSGAAGTILGLLALHKANPQESFLITAEYCGKHLLKNRQNINGYLICKSTETHALTGFSHGAAGIAYALLRLHQYSPRSDFYTAAQTAIAYEQSLFNSQAGNWPDLREPENPGFMTSWCHGAPGIALARLGGLHLLDTIDIRWAIETAVNTTLEFGMQPIDHACCGNCGRLETLIVAAQKLQRADLLETARKQVSWLMQRARDRGGYYLFPHLPKEVYNPGFFQGMSGIGYSLLRAADPETLPSILLWD